MSDPVYSLKKLACIIPDQYITHPAQIHPMVIKVKEDADRMYAEDERWEKAHDHEKAFAVSVLNKIVGMEFPVTSSDYANNILFHNIKIIPKIDAKDVFGVPVSLGAAFIPADYCEVARGCFPEAK